MLYAFLKSCVHAFRLMQKKGEARNTRRREAPNLETTTAKSCAYDTVYCLNYILQIMLYAMRVVCDYIFRYTHTKPFDRKTIWWEREKKKTTSKLKPYVHLYDACIFQANPSDFRFTSVLTMFVSNSYMFWLHEDDSKFKWQYMRIKRNKDANIEYLAGNTRVRKKNQQQQQSFEQMNKTNKNKTSLHSMSY